MTSDAGLPPPDSPFHPDNRAGYAAWREAKLAGYPERLEALVVEVRDPRALSAAEHDALLQRCRKSNFALYASGCLEADKTVPAELGRQFGLERLDHNWLADEDAITPLTVSDRGARPDFIPYTDRPIRWHTDGYYNTPERQIHGLILHCVHPAAEGGGNALLDPEIAYLLLRDEDPELVRALFAPAAMTIPPREEEGGVARGAAVGPVFAVRPDGRLHMRYTARRRNIEWHPEATAAVAALERLLASDLPWIFRGRLEAGMGLLCNNVLHDRAGFHDAPGQAPRLLYRARYYDRIRGT